MPVIPPCSRRSRHPSCAPDLHPDFLRRSHARGARRRPRRWPVRKKPGRYQARERTTRGSVVGWGLVINQFAEAAAWNNWQGYLLGPIGGKEGTWAWANLGVLVALAIGFLGWLTLGRSVVSRQEGPAETDTGLGPLR